MTANAFKEDVKATRDAGMDEHIIKPIDPPHLYEVLAAFLDGEKKEKRPDSAGNPRALNG